MAVEDEGRLRITVRAHWTRRLVPRRPRTPRVRVDGREVPCRWGEQLRVDLAPGRYRVEVLAHGGRTSGAGAPGAGGLDVDVVAGGDTLVEAVGGPGGGAPFRVRVVPRL